MGPMRRHRRLRRGSAEHPRLQLDQCQRSIADAAGQHQRRRAWHPGHHGKSDCQRLDSQHYGGPEADVLGNERWVWAWNQPSRQFSLSASDGSDFRQLAGPTDTVLDMWHPVSTGSQFLIETELTTRSMIAASDGTGAPHTVCRSRRWIVDRFHCVRARLRRLATRPPNAGGVYLRVSGAVDVAV